MPCSITFTINKSGKLQTKVSWGESENSKNIQKFRKMLKALQKGQYNIDICEAVIDFANKNMDRETGKQILKVLADRETFGGPMIWPQEMAEEI